MTTKLPAISIGIPFYNAEATILDAVRSVFLQTHQDWELILLDDGSTDRSLQLAKSIDDARVSVYSDGKNYRLAARLNQIARLAKHDFIARMDADDLMSPVRIERQLKLLSLRPDIDLVSTGVCSLTDDFRPTGIRGISEKSGVTPRGLLSGNSGIVHASLVGRRAWFLRNNYRENLARSEDANLWVRAFSNEDLSIAFINKPYYYYREDQNITASKLLVAYRETRKTILEDAGNKFHFSDKLVEISRSLAKSAAIGFLGAIDNLEFARRRRNAISIGSEELGELVLEIKKIREYKLPSRE